MNSTTDRRHDKTVEDLPVRDSKDVKGGLVFKLNDIIITTIHPDQPAQPTK
jgi:hypothetical protein